MREFSKQHAWFALFVLVVFALGLGTGLTLGRFAGPARVRQGGPPPFGRAQGPPLNRLTRDLDLTPDQQKQMEGVLQEAGRRFEEFRGRSRNEFEALRVRLSEDILGVLTAEQQERFKKLVPPLPGPGRPPLGGHPPAGPPPGELPPPPTR